MAPCLLALFQRNRVRCLAPTWLLTAVDNPSSRGILCPFLASGHQACRCCSDTHVGKTSIHIKQSLKKTKKNYSSKCPKIARSVSGHSSRIESCEGNSEPLWENSKKTRHESCDLSVFKTRNFSWNVFSCSSQVWHTGVSLSCCYSCVFLIV